MNQQLIEQVLKSPAEEAIDALLEDNDTVFYVDWREEDDAIIEYCESRIQTGSLEAELVDVDTDDGYEIHISYKDQRLTVPLTYTEADRHITICTLNEILKPDYEVRFCIDSNGSDTVAFLPLSSSDWKDLEDRYGDAVSKRFYKIAEKPNIFTDPLNF